MPELKARFEKAQRDVNALANRPDDDTLLNLYALHKQATRGDVSGERPGALDFMARAKYDAWKAIEGISADDAIHRSGRILAALIGVRQFGARVSDM